MKKLDFIRTLRLPETAPLLGVWLFHLGVADLELSRTSVGAACRFKRPSPLNQG